MNTEDYKKHLFHPKTNNFQLLSVLKKEGDLTKIRKIYKRISTHPFVQKVFKINNFPAEYSEIRKSKPVPFSNNFIGEASFYILAFEENKTPLKSFIVLKEDFDKAFLLGNFIRAEEILTEIENLIGKSIWLIENRILLKEHQEGVKSNWNIVSDLSKIITNPVILLFIENLSKRAETKISFSRYLNIFNNQIANIRSTELYEYLSFRLNYLGHNNYESLAYFLYMESSSALIDRYLLLKDVLSEMFISYLDEKRDVLILILENLYDIFPEDVQIIQMLSILSSDNLTHLKENIPINLLIEEYSKGNYEYCINQGSVLINTNPTNLELYEVYIKSIIENKVELDLDIFSSQISNILTILYNIYSHNENADSYLDQGLKIAVSFYSTNWAKQFLSLIKSSMSIGNGNKVFTIQYVINSKIKNARILYFVEAKKINQYVALLDEENNIPETVAIVSNIIGGDYVAIMNHEFLTVDKKQIYYGRALLCAKEFNIAREHFEKVYLQNRNPLFNEEVVLNLFRCYLKLNANKEACKLFVEEYLKSKQMVRRLDRLKLLASLSADQPELLKDLIDIPIFYSISSFDSYQKYTAYDTYLEGQGVNRPSELIKLVDNFDDRLIYFFREVCTIEIMHHSYYYTGTDDIESERSEILNTLIVVDKANEDLYIKEITELNQNSNIRKAIREVNKGRISVNVQQLRNYETNNVKEAFNRYREIESYSKTKEIVGIDSTNMLKELTNIDELPDKIVFTSDPAFISFKVIFIEIRDKFILSKEYGLDGYLSTRIRHGTLLNHVRSVFESENIISQRDKDNNYLENDFWNTSIPYNLIDKRTNIQEAIKKFSRSIDEYTEFIIKELIQVKTEKYTKKPKALFDFSIGNSEFAILFATARDNIKDHNTFLSFVFEYLQLFTEKLLFRIRFYINNEIKNNFNRILQDFNTEIKSIIGYTPFPELTTAISLCGTRLQDELLSISEWFYLSDTSKDLVLDLKVLIQTAIQITNTIYPNSQLAPTIIEQQSIPLVATVHLIYVCRIMLDNIIQHADLAPQDLNVEINSQISQDDYLEISFKNNLSDFVDQDKLKEKLLIVKNKWEISSNDYENIDTEGGSGFDKIRRIIAFDLGSETYKFDYKIENNFLTITLSIKFLNIPEYVASN